MHMVPQQTPCSLLISDITLLPEPIWEATPETQLVAQGPPPPPPRPTPAFPGPHLSPKTGHLSGVQHGKHRPMAPEPTFPLFFSSPNSLDRLPEKKTQF